MALTCLNFPDKERRKGLLPWRVSPTGGRALGGSAGLPGVLEQNSLEVSGCSLRDLATSSLYLHSVMCFMGPRYLAFSEPYRHLFASLPKRL